MSTMPAGYQPTSHPNTQLTLTLTPPPTATSDKPPKFIEINTRARPVRRLLCIIGDSQVKMFQLVKTRGDVAILACVCPGRTAQGFSKPDKAWKNEVYRRCASVIAKTNPATCTVSLAFGNVDFSLTAHHQLMTKGAPNTFNPERLALSYHRASTEFVSALGARTTTTRFTLHIISPPPTAVKYADVPLMLSSYGIISREIAVLLLHHHRHTSRPDPTTEFTTPALCTLSAAFWNLVYAQPGRLRAFNAALRTAATDCDAPFTCKHTDAAPLVTDDHDKSIRPEFIDASPYNIHLLYTPMLRAYARALACSSDVCNWDAIDQDPLAWRVEKQRALDARGLTSSPNASTWSATDQAPHTRRAEKERRPASFNTPGPAATPYSAHQNIPYKTPTFVAPRKTSAPVPRTAAPIPKNNVPTGSWRKGAANNHTTRTRNARTEHSHIPAQPARTS